MVTAYNTYRVNEINKKLQIAKFRPLDIMVTGVTGAGKSTTLNTFFQKTVAKVGTGVEPETMGLDTYSLNNSIRFWDTPGLGDGVQQDKVHTKKLIELLYKTYSLDNNTYGFIDIALIIIEGSNRDMGTTYQLLNDVIVPNIQKDRILVAINQADIAMKGRHWLPDVNKPDEKLKSFLERQSLSIQKRVFETTGVNIIKPVYYSAEYNFNIHKLLNMIIDNMPLQRRKLMK
ncbi:GTP-binding protein EngB [Clostridium tepidiprofundi DSM 19306]|uniref:GTP-binding protein EngB n=1 Tax=Clostridium tepidiprofundi DSM 19306 TaxID=1121338 RepID=A0A151B4V4_9CLOT|nr:GTPase [Clostridium tepidiprofundi]KYH34830.1 GTP-binding protein EngB [Clostridium tepidiprofundi DSM 19306]